MIKYLLMDVHGVLTDGKERKRMVAYLEKRRGMHRRKHNVMWKKYINELDDGKMQPSSYLKIVNGTFGTDFSVREYYGLFLKRIKVNHALLRKLRSVKNVCIVSDTLSPITSGLDALFGRQFSKYRKFYSFRYGKGKPEGLLGVVVRKLGARPKDCLLVDDSKKNIRTAKKAGLNAVLFRNNKALFREFRRFGII